MMKKVLCLLLLVISLIGCEKEATLTFEAIDSKESSDHCDDESCAEIALNYVLAKGDEKVQETINEAIISAILPYLNYSEDEGIETIDAAKRSFFKSFEENKEEFESEASWYAFIFGDVSYQTDQLISIRLDVEMYVGGAHGYQSTKYLNFDPKTGNIMEPKDLFEDLDGFIALAEGQFRNKYKIPEVANINSAGFDFENDQFHLPETIGFTKEHIVMTYKPYEIAPYTEGPQSLTIDYATVEEYLKKR
ncbi:PdaC/SigV domain-containing protein [Sungkyunkwania multivorans]|uniref:PdaC/SigV domain-containing protein n=1 Tax=Sungkyunkwania multivorans TaxID=1173618 RepID=A0ABW3D037_9FLAO